MKIVITNDDGPFAPCLKVWPSILRGLAEVIIVVPSCERSTSGHGLTITRPLDVHEVSKNFYIVDGYPADCAFIATTTFIKGCPPDLVISGINRGGNLGQDVYYSGTAAAAREAAFRGVPSLSVSLTLELAHKKNDCEEDYLVPCQIIRQLIEKGVTNLIPHLSFLNVNIPYEVPIKGALRTTLGFRRYVGNIAEVTTPRKRVLPWPDAKYEGFDPIKKSDCVALDNHYLSVTPISPLQNTIYPHEEALDHLLEDMRF